MLKINYTNTRMKQTNNVILTKICNNSTLLILYFNCIINFKHIYIYIYIYIYKQNTLQIK